MNPLGQWRKGDASVVHILVRRSVCIMCVSGDVTSCIGSAGDCWVVIRDDGGYCIELLF